VGAIALLESRGKVPLHCWRGAEGLTPPDLDALLLWAPPWGGVQSETHSKAPAASPKTIAVTIARLRCEREVHWHFFHPDNDSIHPTRSVLLPPLRSLCVSANHPHTPGFDCFSGFGDAFASAFFLKV
jgi:hypothetical protein